MRQLRFEGLAAVLLVSRLLAGNPASAQQSAPPLSPQARARLLVAAEKDALPAWQRDLMVELGRGVAVDGGGSQRAAVTGPDGTWRQLPPPSARSLHAAAYDPVRDRMVVFGGYSTRDLVNDVWVLQLTGTPEWTRLSPSGTAPSARHMTSAVYDPLRDRMVVFGGLDRGVGYLDDVWALSLGAAPTWSRIEPAVAGPVARARHSAVYDSVGDRMIVFGGVHAGQRGADFGLLNDAWALTLSGVPMWSPLSPAGPAPSPRYDQSAVYDPARDRILVFGGYDGQARLNDVWSLSLKGRPRWRQLNPAGTLPTPRLEHAAILDPAGDRMVVFSGLADGYVSDTWSLSLADRNVWTQITAPSEPSVRWGQTAVYDPVKARMVVFGGTADGYRLVSEIWALTLSSTPVWTNLTTPDTPPGPRWGHAAVFDALHERMLVFGGYDQQLGFLNDAWMLSLAGKTDWRRLQPSGVAPSPRVGSAAIYDPVRDRMLVSGGEGSYEGFSNELWALSLSGEPAWSQITTAGEAPQPRADHSAIYDAANDRMVVYGGVCTSDYLGDVWALALSAQPTWTRLTPLGASPGVRFEHSAIYDPVRERMVIFGGLRYMYFLGDTWALSLGTDPVWTQITPSGMSPAVRAGHRAIYDSARDRMVVSGGFSYSSGSNPSTETWALDFQRSEWTLLQPAGSPPAMEMHSVAYDPAGDRMLVFGGPGVSSDLWELNWDGQAAQAVSAGRMHLTPDTAYPALPLVTPNPSRGDVAISFSVAQAGEARIRIYDVAGRTVRTLASGNVPAGRRTILWDRRDSAGVVAQPGLYFCEVRVGATTCVRRLALVR
jgi:hypothetical protein